MQYKIVISCGIFLFFAFTASAQLHYIVANLDYNSIDQDIEINSQNSSYPDETSSYLGESLLNIDPGNSRRMRLHRLDENDTKTHEIHFSLESGPKIMDVGFQKFDDLSADDFKFHFDGNGKYSMVYPGSPNELYTHGTATDFKILKCPLGVMFIVDNAYAAFTYTAPETRFEAYVEIDQAEDIDMVLRVNELSECLQITDEGLSHAVLSIEAPQSETLLFNRKLKFSYKEKYAIVNGINDQITINIYNRNHELILSDLQLENKKGYNYHTLYLDEYSIPYLDYALLEVLNANKNQKLYLRVTDVQN